MLASVVKRHNQGNALWIRYIREWHVCRVILIVAIAFDVAKQYPKWPLLFKRSIALKNLTFNSVKSLNGNFPNSALRGV